MSGIQIVEVAIVRPLDDDKTVDELRELARAEAVEHGINLENNAPTTSRNPVVVDGELVDPMETDQIVYIYVGTVEA